MTDTEKLFDRSLAFLNRTVTANPFIPHVPTPKQAVFLAATVSEAFFGGAAGGGKSDALLMAALQFADVPGYAALLLRKTYADLNQPNALIPRSMAWLGATEARWTGSNHTWTFPSGAIVRFGYIDDPNDIFQFQSSEFQFIGFDEVTEFRESDYRFMFSRLRKPKGVDVPLRMRSGSNPIGKGKEWVKQRFVVKGREEGRLFVPSLLTDNPHLDRESYLQSLSQLDRVTRAQLEKGDWEIRATAGAMFQRGWFEVVEAAPAGWRRARTWDFAASAPEAGKDPDWTVGMKGTRDEQGIYFIENVVRFRGTPATVEATVLNVSSQDGVQCLIHIPQDPGAAGKSEADRYVRALAGYTVVTAPVLRDKIERASPASVQAEHKNIKLVRGPWIEDLLVELEDFPDGAHDDQVDVLSDLVAALAELGPRASSVPKENATFTSSASQFPRYRRAVF